MLTDKWTAIKSYEEECYVRFCLGDLNLDSDWDNYIATLAAMGLQDVVDIWNACYSRMQG